MLFIYAFHSEICFWKKNDTGTPALTRFFGPRKNRVKGNPCYRRSILVLMGLFGFKSPLFEHFCVNGNCKRALIICCNPAFLSNMKFKVVEYLKRHSMIQHFNISKANSRLFATDFYEKVLIL